MHVRLDGGVVFVRAVIVGRDATGAVIDPFAKRGIPNVGQVIGFGALCKTCIFDFYKVAHMHIRAQLGPWPEPRKRPHPCPFAHHDTRVLILCVPLDVCVGQDVRARFDVRVRNHAVGIDLHAAF